jgi:hypothetical protein
MADEARVSFMSKWLAALGRFLLLVRRRRPTASSQNRNLMATAPGSVYFPAPVFEPGFLV